MKQPKNSTAKGREVYIENAERDTVVAVRIDNDLRAAVIRKSDDDGLYIINTRKGSFEKTGRERIEIADAGFAIDGVWCAKHDHYKMVTPSGALYCRDCSREYLKDWQAKKRAGLVTSKTPEERAAEREARAERVRNEAAAARAAALQLNIQQGLRRTEAFFIDTVRKHGDIAARQTYGRYLTDERMDQIVRENNLIAC